MGHLEQINQIIELNNTQKIIEQANKLSNELDEKTSKLGFNDMFGAVYSLYTSSKEQNYPTKDEEKLEIAINKVVISTLEILKKVEVSESEKIKIKDISFAKLSEAIDRLLDITNNTKLSEDAIVISFRYRELKKQIDKT
jgi:hypothetical protein